MIRNKQSARALTAFLVTWAFLVLTVTGIVLYIVPQGRVAYWVHWSLGGMEKAQWGWVHMMFGGVFIVTGVLHLYFNWKPFKNYFAERAKGHFEMKREVFIASGLTIAIFIVSALNMPPASWVIDLNEQIKNTWVTSPELEPPFGHAEEMSLAGVSRRMNIDLNAAIDELRKAGLQVDSKDDSLERIARRSQVTPMEVYELMRRHLRAAAPPRAGMSAQQIEDRFSGTGLGRKPLAEVCELAGVSLQVGLAKLQAAGIAAQADESARDIAARHELNPVDLVKIMLAD